MSGIVRNIPILSPGPRSSGRSDEAGLLRKTKYVSNRTKGLPLRTVLRLYSHHIRVAAGASQLSVTEKVDLAATSDDSPSASALAAVPRVCQDSFFLAVPFIDEYPSAIAAVLDGHGAEGHRVAHFVAKQLESHMRKLLKALLPLDALAQAFEEADADLREQRNLAIDSSGTTATLALVYNRTLVVAWVGDSRCVLGRVSGGKKFETVDLTKDHRPDSPDEYARITAAGARVNEFAVDFVPSGETSRVNENLRVWNDGEKRSPGLAMTRSFGDALLRSVGVVAAPEIVTYELHAQDSFIILASDGLWNVFKSEEAVRLVSQLRADNVQRAAELLTLEARRRWEKVGEGEDITCCLVWLDSNLERGATLREVVDQAGPRPAPDGG